MHPTLRRLSDSSVMDRAQSSCQKYCCGEGCCKLEALRPRPERIGVTKPDNDAFRFLNLNLQGLSLDTDFTKTVDLLEPKISFGPRPAAIHQREVPGLKMNTTTMLWHVNVYPPEYMKPHPPYSHLQCTCLRCSRTHQAWRREADVPFRC